MTPNFKIKGNKVLNFKIVNFSQQLHVTQLIAKHLTKVKSQNLNFNWLKLITFENVGHYIWNRECIPEDLNENREFKLWTRKINYSEIKYAEGCAY